MKFDDPFELFLEWFEEAKRNEPMDPEAMALATTDARGAPNIRMVLMKEVDTNGFVFYTNAESTKGQELSTNPKAALCFNWRSIRRQVRVRGIVEVVTSEEADTRFASRSRDSKIGAWASKQSRPLENRKVLETAVAEAETRYLDEVPRPPYWSGYRIQPLEIEFWQNRPSRLHERMQYRREQLNQPWKKTLLYPNYPSTTRTFLAAAAAFLRASATV